MNSFIIPILISFLTAGALWASSVSSSQIVPVQTYKGMNYYVLQESKTIVLENPIRVDVSIITKKPDPGYYVNVYGQIDDRVRPEIAEIKNANPGYEVNYLGITTLQKVSVDLGVGPALPIQMTSAGGVFFQAAEFLSQADGDTLIANSKAGHGPKVEVLADAKVPAYTIVDQAVVDYEQTCQSLKDSAPKTNIAGAVNSLLGLFVSNQFHSRGQNLKQRLIESILKKCVIVGDTGSLKASDWPKARVQFQDGQGSETISIRNLDYVSTSRAWNAGVEVSVP